MNGDAAGLGTREALLDAAERQMAEHGIEGADLDAIRLAAGQRNRSAVLYHFGGREGLVRRIAARRRVPVDAARSALLGDAHLVGTPTVAWAARTIVEPALVHLRTQGGRDYLVIIAEQIARLGVRNIFDPKDQPAVDSVRDLNIVLLGLLDGSMATRRRRVGQAWLVAFALLADVARDVTVGRVAVRTALSRRDEIVAMVQAVLETGP